MMNFDQKIHNMIMTNVVGKKLKSTLSAEGLKYKPVQ